MWRIFILLSVFLLAACDPPISTQSSTPLIQRGQFIPGLPAAFSLMAAPGESEPSAVDVIRVADRYVMSPRQMPGSRANPNERLDVRSALVDGHPGFYALEIRNDKKGKDKKPVETYIQVVVRRTDAGLEIPILSSKELKPIDGIPGLDSRKKDDAPVSSSLQASQIYFDRRIRQMQQGKLVMKTPAAMTLYDHGDPDAMARLERDYAAAVIAAKQAKEAKEKAKQAAAEERKRKAEAEKRRKAEAAAREKDRMANNKTWFGRWYYVIEKDAMTDRLKQYVYGFPDGHDDFKTSPYLRIGCYGARDEYPMGVTFYWASALEDLYPREAADLVRVTARFNSAKPFEMGWAVSADFGSTYPPSALQGALTELGNGLLGALVPNSPLAKMNTTWNAKQLHNSLRNAGSAVFRAYPRSGRDLTLQFDMSGYRDAVANFQEHCNS